MITSIIKLPVIAAKIYHAPSHFVTVLLSKHALLSLPINQHHLLPSLHPSRPFNKRQTKLVTDRPTVATYLNGRCRDAPSIGQMELHHQILLICDILRWSDARIDVMSSRGKRWSASTVSSGRRRKFISSRFGCVGDTDSAC